MPGPPNLGSKGSTFPSTWRWNGRSSAADSAHFAEHLKIDAVGYRVAHSIYFQVLGEHGFVGLALYLALGVSTFLMGGSIARRARDRPDLAWARDLARMLQASLATFAVVGAFLSRDFFDLTIHLVAIMILTGAVVRQSVAAKAPELARPVSAQPAQ